MRPGRAAVAALALAAGLLVAPAATGMASGATCPVIVNPPETGTSEANNGQQIEIAGLYPVYGCQAVKAGYFTDPSGRHLTEKVQLNECGYNTCYTTGWLTVPYGSYVFLDSVPFNWKIRIFLLDPYPDESMPHFKLML